MIKYIITIILCFITTLSQADLFKVTINTDEYKVFKLIESPYKTEYELMHNSFLLLPRNMTAVNQKVYFFIRDKGNEDSRTLFIPFDKINFIEIEKKVK